MTSIFIKGIEKRDKIFGFGDFASYSLACRCKAKEMGCDEIWAVFPKLAGVFKNEENRMFQEVKQLNINFIKKTETYKYEGKFDIEYELYNEYMGTPSITNYLNYYYLKYGKYETYENLEKLENKKYVLFHVRNIPGKNKRNLKMSDLEPVFIMITKLLGDKYEYWKIGEPCPLDNLFDKVIPNSYDDIESFINLIGRCSLFIGSSSGPFSYVQLFDNIPYMIIGCIYPDPYLHGPRAFIGNASLKYGTRAYEFMGNKFYGKYMTNQPPSISDIREMISKEKLI
jgi:hypothetical protein